MLRWTCRLRDVLQQSEFLVEEGFHSRRLSGLREAEFVSPAGAFPNKFRWQTFRDCIRASGGVLALYNPGGLENPTNIVRAIDPSCQMSMSVRSVAGETVDLQHQKIDVLWLSSSVFISRFSLQVGKVIRSPTVRSLVEYNVSFKERDEPCQNISLDVTSLSLFTGAGRHEPSSLPLQFFQHLTALLPSDYFKFLFLLKLLPRVCPMDCTTRFLSIIPNHAVPTASRNSTVRVLIMNTVARDELQQILSHPFNPSVTLGFTYNPFDESVSLTILNDLLKDSRYLRAVELPMGLVSSECWRDSCATLIDEIVFISPDLEIHCSAGGMSPKWLQAIAKKHSAREIRLTFAGYQPYSSRDLLRPFIHPLMDDDTSLENLRLCFHYKNADNDFDEQDHEEIIRFVARCVAREMPACKSRNLCVLNVSTEYTSENKESRWQCNRMHNRIQWWDEAIVPPLVLNLHRKRLTTPAGVAVLLAIRAVNQGIVHHKTTAYIPLDPSTANAGLIFRMVKSQAQRQVRRTTTLDV
jgi:hypothetical protein